MPCCVGIKKGKIWKPPGTFVSSCTLVSAGNSHKHTTLNQGCSIIHKGWIQSWRQCCSNTQISHFHHSCFVKRYVTFLRRNCIKYGSFFITTFWFILKHSIDGGFISNSTALKNTLGYTTKPRLNFWNKLSLCWGEWVHRKKSSVKTFWRQDLLSQTGPSFHNLSL